MCNVHSFPLNTKYFPTSEISESECMLEKTIVEENVFYKTRRTQGNYEVSRRCSSSRNFGVCCWLFGFREMCNISRLFILGERNLISLHSVYLFQLISCLQLISKLFFELDWVLIILTVFILELKQVWGIFFRLWVVS